MPTKRQLQKRIDELEEENDSLQGQLDDVYEIVARGGNDEGEDDSNRNDHEELP